MSSYKGTIEMEVDYEARGYQIRSAALVLDMLIQVGDLGAEDVRYCKIVLAPIEKPNRCIA